MDEHQDLEAIRACLEGDLEAFGSLVVRYQKQVMNAAYRILRNADDARDVSQAVFVKAFGRLSSFDPRYKFFSWLYRIAVNESLNFAGKRNRRIDPAMSWTEAVSDPADQRERGERNEGIDRALRELKARERALLALSVDGLTYGEIGRMLGLSEKKVKSRLFETRRKLREILIREGWHARA